MLKEADITAVIPPVKSRKEQRAYSHELYRARHVIENVFRALKRRRGIATRYAKLTASFIAAIHVMPPARIPLLIGNAFMPRLSVEFLQGTLAIPVPPEGKTGIAVDLPCSAR
jgi:hypothetical protein